MEKKDFQNILQGLVPEAKSRNIDLAAVNQDDLVNLAMNGKTPGAILDGLDHAQKQRLARVAASKTTSADELFRLARSTWETRKGIEIQERPIEQENNPDVLFKMIKKGQNGN